jgi:Ino eighty subunit 2
MSDESSELSDISLSEAEDIVDDQDIEENDEDEDEELEDDQDEEVDEVEDDEDVEEDEDDELDEEDDFEDSAEEYAEPVAVPKANYQSRIILKVGSDKGPHKRDDNTRGARAKQRFVSDESESSTPAAGLSVEDTLDTGEMDEEDDEEEFDSGAATPDFSRMTARQRARYASDAPEGLLLELPPEPIKRKVLLTAEEQQLKRAELARRRKNLSERRLEEEKQDTLDKLLKKRAPKNRRKGDDDESAFDEDAPPSDKKSRLLPTHPAMYSWTSSKSGLTLSFTDDKEVPVRT